jgi:hypothetical protein
MISRKGVLIKGVSIRRVLTRRILIKGLLVKIRKTRLIRLFIKIIKTSIVYIKIFELVSKVRRNKIIKDNRL